MSEDVKVEMCRPCKSGMHAACKGCEDPTCHKVCGECQTGDHLNLYDGLCHICFKISLSKRPFVRTTLGPLPQWERKDLGKDQSHA